MKKMNNKGFSLVELIIVIAIMAILAGAIAPALIRYIDKSRKSNDISAAKTIKTSVETALGNEDIYNEVFTGSNSSYGPVEVCSESLSIGTPEIKTNLGGKAPSVKYKKDGQQKFFWEASASGQVTVYVGTSSNKTMYELAPELHASYK